MNWLLALTSILVVVLGQSSLADPVDIINGEPIPPGAYDQVVLVKAGSSTCTGTLVGPKVVLIAGHCLGAQSPAVEFTVGGETYTGIGMRSGSYSSKNHDLAVVISFKSVTKIVPLTVVMVLPQVGQDLKMVGWGCQKPETSPPAFASLGVAKVSGKETLEYTTVGQQALCFGDSGAPALYEFEEEKVVVGVGSKSNMKDMSYFTRLDTLESEQFFETVLQTFNVSICGISANCDTF